MTVTRGSVAAELWPSQSTQNQRRKQLTEFIRKESAEAAALQKIMTLSERTKFEVTEPAGL